MKATVATLSLGLILAVCWLLVQRSSHSTPRPSSHPSRFDRFVYLRHNEVNGVALTDSLIQVSLTAKGFEAQPVYSESNLYVAWTPLCVRRGRLYAVKLDKLTSIDLATGKVQTMEDYIESFTFVDGRLYAMVRQPGGDKWWLRVYDFDTQSYRNITAIAPVRIPMNGYNPAPAPRLSPDKQWLAYLSPSLSNSVVLRFQFQLVSVESGAARACGEPLQTREFSTGAGSVAVGPAFTWVTPKTILVVRDESKQLSSQMGLGPGGTGFRTIDGSTVEMRLASLDIDSGQMTNLMRLPTFQPGIAEPYFRPAEDSAVPLIVLGELGRYRIDLSTGRVSEDDGLRGPYRFRRVKGLGQLFFGTTRLDSNVAMPQVSVSPDGQCVAWEAQGPGGPSGEAPRSMIRFHRGSGDKPQTVASEWIPEVYETGYRHSLEGNLLWFSSADLPAGIVEHPAPGWISFPLLK